ncbi:uncharacterized protein A1O5_04624 [Cladophialophora psammophila CBS 110553]|uniref:Uncharacterized protein n=1 Tax=Cladophialophora psammophila CBS 110553 TaxID=1182543 RepID=W9X490_9EURO|nr:uncharacterized protein A1O5_04624 [Cladophialophora psammophila CBS 110553]EXJ72120.1 hypothetical protein A1O5_04624 [Cladophialophora psammophila CBS 110553]
MVIANATCLYLSLNNPNFASKQQQPERVDARDIHHSEFGSSGSNTRASEPVSLMVSIEGHNTYWVEAAGLVVPIVKDLDPREAYRVRLTHMGGPNGTGGVLEFEGIWVDKATFAEVRAASSASNETRSPARLLPFDERFDKTAHNDQNASRPRREIVEIVTSEISLSAMNHRLHLSTLRNDSHERIQTWCKQLGAESPVDTVILDTTGIGLMSTGESGPSMRDQFFRAGPPGTRAFARPWNFKLYSPSVLLLQLGLVDFVQFFSPSADGRRSKPVNRHDLAKFTNEFVDAYIKLIQAIRANAYPFDPTTTTMTGLATDLDDDGSYIYNSAPSTLSIFLLTPFSATRHSVTKKLKLDKVISNALTQVAATLQADGDKSTFWIDTTGWLDAATDFEGGRPDDPNSSPESPPPRSSVLNRSGRSKVATLLTEHLCPYIAGPSPSAGSPQAEEAPPGVPRRVCPFDRYDHYLGNVYLPTDVDFDRTLLEHKIESIKLKFNL